MAYDVEHRSNKRLLDPLEDVPTSPSSRYTTFQIGLTLHLRRNGERDVAVCGTPRGMEPRAEPIGVCTDCWVIATA